LVNRDIDALSDFTSSLHVGCLGIGLAEDILRANTWNVTLVAWDLAPADIVLLADICGFHSLSLSRVAWHGFVVSGEHSKHCDFFSLFNYFNLC